MRYACVCGYIVNVGTSRRVEVNAERVVVLIRLHCTHFNLPFTVRLAKTNNVYRIRRGAPSKSFTNHVHTVYIHTNYVLQINQYLLKTATLYEIIPIEMNTRVVHITITYTLYLCIIIR